MNKLTVTHFVRKSSQLRASFIQNQILFLKRYAPRIVYKNLSTIDDDGFATFNNSNIDTLFLNEDVNNLSRIKYKLLKLITKKERNKITDFIENSDILHFHYGTDAGIYLPLLKNVRITKVVSFYGYDCSGFPKRIWGLGKEYLKKRVFRYADKVFAMSHDMEKDLIEAGCVKEKIIVHYHGSDTKKFYEKRNWEKKGKFINFIIISGFVPQKGHIFLLKAFKESWQRNKNIRLIIVGDGPLRTEIENFINKNNMSSYVTLKNKTLYSSEEHKEYLRNADVFIHPSVTDVNDDKEGIPGAIVEAMASGLPVIATYHAGIPYVLKHKETGYLVKEWDVKKLSNYICEFAEDAELRKKIGKNAQNEALENLDLKKKEEELEEIYDYVINVHKGSCK